MPETRLVANLKGTSAVTDLIGTGDDARLYFAVRPQGTALPAITYQRVGTTAFNHAHGQCDFAQAMIQVNCLASSISGAKALAAVVTDALSGWSDLTGDPLIDMSHWLGDSDAIFEVPGQDARDFAVMQDYLIQYKV